MQGYVVNSVKGLIPCRNPTIFSTKGRGNYPPLQDFTIFSGIVARGDWKLYNVGVETGWINKHDQNFRVKIRT